MADVFADEVTTIEGVEQIPVLAVGQTTRAPAEWLVDVVSGQSLGGLDLRDAAACDTHRVSQDNYLEWVIDGEAYTRQWFALLDSVRGESGSRVIHCAWRFDEVRADGAVGTGLTSYQALEELTKSGTLVETYLSSHLGLLATGRAARTLRSRGVPAFYSMGRRRGTTSCHDKFTVTWNANPHGRPPTALVGVDISNSRWDGADHRPVDPRRPPSRPRPTHDVGVLVAGSAGRHLVEATEVLRRTRVDKSRFGERPIPGPIKFDRAGDLGVLAQVLRTQTAIPGFCQQDSSVLNAYLNAFEKAERYIYIEDQYFNPFFAATDIDNGGGERDLLQQLVSAVQRGVTVLVGMPRPRSGLTPGRIQAQHRHVAIEALRRAQSPTSGAGEMSGRFYAFLIRRSFRPVYVHSKVLICDDEFAVVGSANVNRRSMRTDSETSVAIADSAAAARLRIMLWAEHLAVHPQLLAEPTVAIGRFARAISNGRGNVARYPRPVVPSRLGPLATQLWNWIDPT